MFEGAKSNVGSREVPFGTREISGSETFAGNARCDEYLQCCRKHLASHDSVYGCKTRGYGSPNWVPRRLSCEQHPSHNVVEALQHSYGSHKFLHTNTNHPTLKRRKSSKDVPDAPVTAKRSRNQLTTNQLPVRGTETFPPSGYPSINQESVLQFSAVQSSSHDTMPNGSPFQGSSVAKCLFNQPSRSPPTNSSGPKTPPQATSSQIDKSVSPLEVSSTATSSNNGTPQQIISTNCTVISSGAIRVSPAKQIAYYSVERNHCISSSSPVKTNLNRLGKRDHVKGRLDFDGSDVPVKSDKSVIDGISASQANKELEMFDFDLPNLDALGLDFSLSELLVDFDLDGEGIDYSCQPTLCSPDTLSESQNEAMDVNLGANQVLSEFSSTVTEIFSERDMNAEGPDSLTSVKSITKCVKILSPVKNQTSSRLDQENVFAKN
ncbi:hypothetical protein F0562_016246 [Nyssa sinensis]|uniref:Uncharacterized protein n=1 Tax=Nyssa sinensis TaxID=561372 RepID=A0A5J4ZJX3_9ASTE|nr:hypothetical protein F0562_016246 [Nyssa sinensis]